MVTLLVDISSVFVDQVSCVGDMLPLFVHCCSQCWILWSCSCLTSSTVWWVYMNVLLFTISVLSCPFLSFRCYCQLLESMLDPVKLQLYCIVYCSVSIHVCKCSCIKYSWNKFSRVPHKNILESKICQVEITVHVLPVKGLLGMCVYLFIMLQKQLNVVRSVQCVTHCNQCS